MKPIKEFDKVNIKMICSEIDEAVQSVAEKYGIKLERGNASYRTNNFVLKINGSVLTDTGQAMTREASDFQKMAPLFGLSADDLGKEFVANGKRFVITGLKPRSPKYPILAAEVGTGTTYKFQVDTVVRRLKGKVA